MYYIFYKLCNCYIYRFVFATENSYQVIQQDKIGLEVVYFSIAGEFNTNLQQSCGHLNS